MAGAEDLKIAIQQGRAQLGRAFCDCEMQELVLELTGEHDPMTVAECREMIKKAGGGAISVARCGIVARDRVALFERNTSLTEKQ